MILYKVGVQYYIGIYDKIYDKIQAQAMYVDSNRNLPVNTGGEKELVQVITSFVFLCR